MGISIEELTIWRTLMYICAAVPIMLKGRQTEAYAEANSTNTQRQTGQSEHASVCLCPLERTPVSASAHLAFVRIICETQVHRYPRLRFVRSLHHLDPSLRLLHKLFVLLPSIPLEYCLQLLRHPQELEIDIVGLSVLDLYATWKSVVCRASTHKRLYSQANQVVAVISIEHCNKRLFCRFVRFCLVTSHGWCPEPIAC